MSYEIRADYKQMYLLPPSLEEWIPEDHPARYIRDFVESLDLEGMGFKEPECENGRPAYSTDLLLKVWLYGYYKKIRSSRGLEEACYDQVGLIWLTGMHYPDHNTIWRFWRENKKTLRQVFKEVVMIAQRVGLIGFVLHAVDGSKIGSQASNDSGWHLKDLREKLKGIEEAIERYMREVDSAKMEENREFRLPEDMKDQGERRERIRDAIKELEATGRAHMHPKDKDARMMKTERGIAFAYNAQAVVDAAGGIIVAEDVVNEENDGAMLVPMIEETERNVGRVAEETVADGGYYSAQQLAQAQEREIEVVLPIKKQVYDDENRKPFHKSRFEYNKTRDIFTCPMGKELTFEGIRRNRGKKYPARIYRCQSFEECRRRWECSREKCGRVIEMGPHEEAVARQIQKQQDPHKRDLLKKRKAVIELVFGQIKQNQGFRRFTVRGLESVRTQWSLVCSAFNLRKLYRYWCNGILAWA